jgi:hypothetical protein
LEVPNKVGTDYGASNEVAVQAGFLFDCYPVLKVLLEPSIRLGRPKVAPSPFRTGANEVVWEFSDIKCAHMNWQQVGQFVETAGGCDQCSVCAAGVV